MKFLRNVLATIVGLFLFTFFFFFLFVGLASLSGGEEKVEIKDNSILHLKLIKPVQEREVENPFEGLPGFPGIDGGAIGLMELKEAIRHAADDEKIRGIFLETPYLRAGISTNDDIRSALEEFKESGKFIYSYAEFYTEGAYYLASVADSIFLNPDFSMLEFNGLNMQQMYFKRMFEKLEIEPVVFRVGDYKEIAEPFTRESMSPQVRKRNTELLMGIQDDLLKKVADSRSLPFDEVKNTLDSALVDSEEDAVKYGLVDKLTYRDEMMEILKNKVGAEDVDDLHFVSYKKYRKSYSTYKSSKNRIAVLVAAGSIVTGKGEKESIGSDKYAKEIRKLAEDDKVKAIVLRINSGGGSALASDIMWRELRLAAEKKPVIASMSDYAASGGYFLAMACDTIVAQPNTITGSIGVFSMLMNIKGFLNDKLGITTDNIKTGKFADLYSATKPMTEYEKQIVQKSTEEAYKAFLTKAAESRGKELDEIEKVASGRIWTGREALENGLVDQLGDLDDAISIAAQAAGVDDDYKVRVYPAKKDPFSEFLEALQGEEDDVVAEKLGKYRLYFEGIKSLAELEGVQARSLVRVDF